MRQASRGSSSRSVSPRDAHLASTGPTMAPAWRGWASSCVGPTTSHSVLSASYKMRRFLRPYRPKAWARVCRMACRYRITSLGPGMFLVYTHVQSSRVLLIGHKHKLGPWDVFHLKAWTGWLAHAERKTRMQLFSPQPGSRGLYQVKPSDRHAGHGRPQAAEWH